MKTILLILFLVAYMVSNVSTLECETCSEWNYEKLGGCAPKKCAAGFDRCMAINYTIAFDRIDDYGTKIKEYSSTWMKMCSSQDICNLGESALCKLTKNVIYVSSYDRYIPNEISACKALCSSSIVVQEKKDAPASTLECETCNKWIYERKGEKGACTPKKCAAGFDRCMAINFTLTGKTADGKTEFNEPTWMKMCGSQDICNLGESNMCKLTRTAFDATREHVNTKISACKAACFA